VLIWEGVWRPQGDPHDGYRQVLKFRLMDKTHGA
jgi:hypothetical protein